MQQACAAINRERREVLDVDVPADLAVVLDIEPKEVHLRPRLRDPFKGGSELIARIAPGGAKSDDQGHGAPGEVRLESTRVISGQHEKARSWGARMMAHATIHDALLR